jgi:hypothetical protein
MLRFCISENGSGVNEPQGYNKGEEVLNTVLEIEYLLGIPEKVCKFQMFS